MGVFTDGDEYADYDPYKDRAKYDSSSSGLKGLQGFLKSLFGKKEEYTPTSDLDIAEEEFMYAKQDYDAMNAIGDNDEEVIARYNKAFADYKEKLQSASPEDLERSRNKQPDFSYIDKDVPASKKEPIICNNVQVTERVINYKEFVELV